MSMERIDYAHLAAPLEGDDPAGQDLEYDPGFLELGDVLRPASPGMIADAPENEDTPIDWPTFRERAEGLAETTRDLRLVMRMARLSLFDRSPGGGLPGFVGALTLAATLLETVWADVHPQLDSDDNMDAMMRLNALADLEDPSLLAALLNAPIARSGRDIVTLRDMEVAIGKRDAAADETVSETAGRVAAIFDTSNANSLEHGSDLARQGAEALSRIREAWTSAMADLYDTRRAQDLRFEVLPAPQMEPLEKRMADLSRLIDDRLPDANPDQDEAVDFGAAGDAVSIGGISSRSDADRQILKIIQWFQKNEPSSPVSALLERARSMISKSFLEIIDELGEGGINEARRASGDRGVGDE